MQVPYLVSRLSAWTLVSLSHRGASSACQTSSLLKVDSGLTYLTHLTHDETPVAAARASTRICVSKRFERPPPV
jgi:hypothetical protein